MASTLQASCLVAPTTASFSNSGRRALQAPRSVPRSVRLASNPSKVLRHAERVAVKVQVSPRAVLGLFQGTKTEAEAGTAGPVTEKELADARKIWGDALCAVSAAYEEGGIEAATEVANGALDAAYGYNMGDVLFKPTLASGEQTFRPTKEGALAYFVGHNDKYPNDSGFGIKGWRTAEFETAAQFTHGDVGIWMGNGIFTDKDGNVTKVDKSFGYKKDAEGNLRIIQHHSSLPYQPQPSPITEEELAGARKIWGEALCAVSAAYEEGGIKAATKVANGALDAAYGYNMGDVLFKPTLASGEQTFRPTRDGALAYFVGHSKEYPNDGGFGIKGWTNVEFKTAAQFMQGNIGLWMGNAIFTNKDGSVTIVDKSFGYKKDDEGTLRIIHHHSSLPYSPDAGASVTEEELTAARKAWGDALCAVSKAYDEGGIEAATEVANGALDTAYGYNLGDVLFKPTLASGKQTFRPTKEGALAYFVGNDKRYPNDSGFGIKGWRTAKFETAAQFMSGDVGIWMGNGIFTDKTGKVTKVDKSFGYKKDDQGNLRIIQHHSSLPYEPPKETEDEKSKRRWAAFEAFIKEMRT